MSGSCTLSLQMHRDIAIEADGEPRLCEYVKIGLKKKKKKRKEEKTKK